MARNCSVDSEGLPFAHLVTRNITNWQCAKRNRPYVMNSESRRETRLLAGVTVGMGCVKDSGQSLGLIPSCDQAAAAALR